MINHNILLKQLAITRTDINLRSSELLQDWVMLFVTNKLASNIIKQSKHSFTLQMLLNCHLATFLYSYSHFKKQPNDNLITFVM